MSQYIVLVGTKADEKTKDPDLAGQHVHGPFASLDAAREFAAGTLAAFAEVEKAVGSDKAFPYGNPVVEVHRVRAEQAFDPYGAAVANWVFDPAEA